MVLTGLNQVGNMMVPSEGSGGEAVCLPVLASIGGLHSLAHGPISPSLNQHGLAKSFSWWCHSTHSLPSASLYHLRETL